MRLTLLNQPQIDGLLKPLGDSLRNLVAAIGTGWRTEHKGDGTHTDVTADTITVAGLASVGRLRLSQVTYVEPGATGGTVNNLTVSGLRSAGCLRIEAQSSPLIITGIDAAGFKYGDLLLLLNCDESLAPKDLWLSTEDTGSLAPNRFVHTTASPGGGGAPGGPLIVNGGRGVWLMYDHQETSTAVIVDPKWRIIDTTN